MNNQTSRQAFRAFLSFYRLDFDTFFGLILALSLFVFSGIKNDTLPPVLSGFARKGAIAGFLLPYMLGVCCLYVATKSFIGLKKKRKILPTSKIFLAVTTMVGFIFLAAIGFLKFINDLWAIL